MCRIAQRDDIATHPHTVFVFAAIGKFSELGDGKFVYEIEGLPVGDPDDEFYPNAKPPSRVTFSTGPMQVHVAPAAYTCSFNQCSTLSVAPWLFDLVSYRVVMRASWLR